MRTNEGYEIIVSVPLDDRLEIVIGRNCFDQYVVWHCKDGEDYYWGRYVLTYTQALLKLTEKIMLAVK